MLDFMMDLTCVEAKFYYILLEGIRLVLNDSDD